MVEMGVTTQLSNLLAQDEVVRNHQRDSAHSAMGAFSQCVQPIDALHEASFLVPSPKPPAECIGDVIVHLQKIASVCQQLDPLLQAPLRLMIKCLSKELQWRQRDAAASAELKSTTSVAPVRPSNSSRNPNDRILISSLKELRATLDASSGRLKCCTRTTERMLRSSGRSLFPWRPFALLRPQQKRLFYA